MKKKLLWLALVPVLLGAFVLYKWLSYGSIDSDATPAHELVLDGSTVLMGDSTSKFSGTVVLQNNQVREFGQRYFRDDRLPIGRVPNTDGLVVKVEIKNGVPDGPAEVYLDLKMAENRSELAEYAGTISYQTAALLNPRIKIGAATFVDGELNGPAALWFPNPENGMEPQPLIETVLRNSRPDSILKIYHKTGPVAEVQRLSNQTPHGLHERFYDDGAKRSERYFEDGRETGVWTEWWRNGQLRSRTSYESFEMASSESWYPDGQLKSKSARNVETGTPEVREWYSDGSVKSVRTLTEKTHNPIDGAQKEYHWDGSLKAELTYMNGHLDGPYKRYYSNGQPWEESTYNNGVLTGSFKKWWKNGQLAEENTRVDGKIDGLQQRWYDNGEVWEKATYQNGKVVGEYIKNWNNGQPAYRYTCDDRGRKQGLYQRWYANGQLWEEGTYTDDKAQGEYKKWFNNGQLAYQYQLKDGQYDGEYLKWYDNGTMRLKTTYANGKLNGAFENWLEDGSVYETATYVKGKKTKSSRNK